MNIKIRAWNKKYKEMIYIGDMYWFEENSIHDLNDSNEYIFMLYTGRKDKNNKEIYKSDILKYDGEKCRHCKKLLYPDHDLYVIKWDKKDASFSCENKENSMSACIWTTDMKVIGDIHSNPELLKGEKK